MTRLSVTSSIPWMAFFVLALAGPAAILAADDITPPVLATFSFTPASVNVSAGPATVTLTARITDDLSGVKWGYVDFVSPSGQQWLTNSFYSPPQSGTVNDGTYQFLVTLPQFAEVGTWVLRGVYLKDAAGNGTYLWTEDLTSRGFQTALTVASVQDVQARFWPLSVFRQRPWTPAPGRLR